MGETHGGKREAYPDERIEAGRACQDVRRGSVHNFSDQKRFAVETSVSVKSLTLKRRELLGTPNGWCRGQSAAKPLNEERSTTIPTGSTLKRAEVRRTER